MTSALNDIIQNKALYRNSCENKSVKNKRRQTDKMFYV
jgi:hypothetical protein